MNLICGGEDEMTFENFVEKLLKFIEFTGWIRTFICWHQYIDWICLIDGFKAKEQYCLHCGKWRNK